MTTTPEFPADVTGATPVEIDTVLNDRQYRFNVATQRCAQYRRLAEGNGYHSERYAEDADRFEAEAAALLPEIQALAAEFRRRGGWNRYYLVINSNGHVHRGMECTTCFASTAYSWITDLSDCDEDAAIVEFGESMCTVCFPTAPTHPAFSAPGRRNQAERDARKAEKDAKAAAKREKQIFTVDGSLGVTYPDGVKYRQGQRVEGEFYQRTVETKVAARNALSSIVQYKVWSGDKDGDRQVAIDILSKALKRHGMDPEAIIERATKKAVKG